MNTPAMAKGRLAAVTDLRVAHVARSRNATRRRRETHETGTVAIETAVEMATAATSPPPAATTAIMPAAERAALPIVMADAISIFSSAWRPARSVLETAFTPNMRARIATTRISDPPKPSAAAAATETPITTTLAAAFRTRTSPMRACMRAGSRALSRTR